MVLLIFQYMLRLSKEATVEQLKDALQKKTGVHPENVGNPFVKMKLITDYKKKYYIRTYKKLLKFRDLGKQPGALLWGKNYCTK